MKNLFFILLAFAPAWLLAQKDALQEDIQGEENPVLKMFKEIAETN